MSRVYVLLLAVVLAATLVGLLSPSSRVTC